MSIVCQITNGTELTHIM